MSGPEQSVTVAAPAKVNLYLHVTGRRDDGFHLLDSLVAFAGVHDTIRAEPADGLSLQVDGPFAAALDGEDDNLVLRAARGLADLTGAAQGARLSLTKRLPVAAGIGGGSADAAAALKALMRLWDVRPGERALRALALSLGADVPVCLHGRAAFVGGVGEALDPVPALPPCSMLLVNPLRPLSTPQVFRARAALGEGFSSPGRFDYGAADAGELAALLASRGNDLTDAALSLSPETARVLDALEACEGALLSRMSGSGATCFALFADPGEAAEAALELGRAHPGWWVAAGSLESDINRLG